MPKKFVGENSKAAAARAHKNAIKQEQQSQKQKQMEDEFWRDDDKRVLKKLQRKEEKERKKQELVEKKQTVKSLLEQETNSLKTCKDESKLTRAQIISQLDGHKKAEVKANVVEEEPLVENLNRFNVDGEEASTVDEAIHILGNKSKEVDMHPEKRLKAAFAAFEAENTERLKKEYPTLRLSQIKQLLRKEWMKSPANPLNNL